MQIPQYDHWILLLRKSNTLHCQLNWKYAQWYLRIHERGIRNIGCTPTFWYHRRFHQTFPNWRRPFSSFFGAAIVPVKEITPRYALVSLIITNYSETAWWRWLQNQWCLVCTISPLPDYCNHRHQAVSL